MPAPDGSRMQVPSSDIFATRLGSDIDTSTQSARIANAEPTEDDRPQPVQPDVRVDIDAITSRATTTMAEAKRPRRPPASRA